MKVGAYEVNLGECKSIETHWVVLYVNDTTLIVLVLKTCLKK